MDKNDSKTVAQNKKPTTITLFLRNMRQELSFSELKLNQFARAK